MNWPDNIEQARKIQESLAAKVRCDPLRKKIKLIAGADAAFTENQVFAAACLFSFPELGLLDEVCAVSPVIFLTSRDIYHSEKARRLSEPFGF